MPLPYGRGSAGPPADAGLNRKRPRPVVLLNPGRQRRATHGLGVVAPRREARGQVADLPHQLAEAYADCACRSARSTVLDISMATVSGPTPPGTGLYAAATRRTSSGWTSPTQATP